MIFEQDWLIKLSYCLHDTADEEMRKAVLAGSEALTDPSSRKQFSAWTRADMET